MSALLVAVAVFAALQVLAPERLASTRAWAPVRPLPAGHLLTAEDLVEVRVPVTAESGGAGAHSAGASRAGPGGDLPKESTQREATLVTPETAAGRLLAVAWPAGVPMHTGALAGSEVLRVLPAREAAVALPWDGAPAAGLLEAGDIVDVVVSAPQDDGEARVRSVVTGARVLWAEEPSAAGDGSWLGGGSRQEPGTLMVVLAVPKASAAEVSSAPQRGAVSLVLSG